MLLSNVGRPGSSSISEKVTLMTQIVKWLDAVHIVTAEARAEPMWSDLGAPGVGGSALCLYY